MLYVELPFFCAPNLMKKPYQMPQEITHDFTDTPLFTGVGFAFIFLNTSESSCSRLRRVKCIRD
jgi:hypothetical protein